MGRCSFSLSFPGINLDSAKIGKIDGKEK